MSNEDTGLLLELANKDILEDLLLHIGIQSRDGVVHQNDVLVGIDSSRE